MGNGVYLANFTTGTQMHSGIRNEVDPVFDTHIQKNYLAIQNSLKVLSA